MQFTSFDALVEKCTEIYRHLNILKLLWILCPCVFSFVTAFDKYINYALPLFVMKMTVTYFYVLIV